MTEAEIKIMRKFEDLISDMRAEKPGDRSEKDRHYAQSITQTEIAMATFKALAAGEKSNG